MKRSFVIFLIVLCFFSASAFSDTTVFYKGVRAAYSGRLDFAFMFFRSFLQSYPRSKLAQDAIFALGEYYYFTNNPTMSARHFNRVIVQYPTSKAKIFACAYLLNMAQRSKNEDAERSLKREIVTAHNLSLVFSKYKRYIYESPFNKKYKALYYMDRVQIYINDDLFTEISY